MSKPKDSNKIVMAIAAKTHTEYMDERYKEEIKHCVGNTKIYSEDFKLENKNIGTPNILFVNNDTVSTILNLKDKEDVAVLDFASYKNPGGGFFAGSMAQEEALCHRSFLYNVVREFKDTYYAWNKDNLNRALYKNRALYIPNVLFMDKENEISANVIVCACPNKRAAQKFKRVSSEENKEVLTSRIRFIRDIAEDNNVKTLVLGAFGSGVFGQDANEVAQIMKKTFSDSSIENMVYAVPGKDYNARAFMAYFA